MQTIKQAMANQKKLITKPMQTRHCLRHHMDKTQIGEGRFALWRCPACNLEAENDIMEGAKKRYALIADIEKQDLMLRVDESGIPKLYRDEEFITARHKRESVCKSNEFLNNQEPGMVFIGKHKTGKTLLACSMVEKYIRTGHTAMYSVFLDIILAIKESWTMRTSTVGVIDRFCKPDLLVIDELDLAHGSKTENIYFARIIDRRYSDMKKTILISNLKLSGMRDLIGEKSYRRIAEGQNVLVFDWESYRK